MQLPDKLINGCRKNDRKAQEATYRLLFPEAFKVAMRYSSCEDDAKDVLNRSFFKALTKISDFKGDGSNFFGWLKRIIVNQALDNLRKLSFQKSFIPVEEAENAIERHDVTAKHNYENLIELIQKLPPTSGFVFNLFAIDGYSHREIAERLGISEDNSRYHLHTARKQLKQWIFKMEKL